MRNHLTGLRAASVGFGLAAVAACATSTNTGTGFQTSGVQGGGGSTTGGGGTIATGTGGASGGGPSLSGGSGVSLVGAGSSLSGMPTDARAQRCDDAGMNCHCFNIATVGLGGHTGAQSGATMGAAGTDNTQAFVNYINTQSSAGAGQVGCGADVGCVSKAKPDLSAPGFLAQYDVLIFQWMANSLAPVMMGTSYGFTGDPALGGGGYWVFTQAELDALKTWVMGGGGVIVLSGFDYCPNATLPGCTAGSMGELGPTNQIIEALTDIKYTETDTFGATVTGNAEFCLGGSDPVGGWAAAPDLLGQNITAVGAFHGRGITPGPNATTDCESGTTVCAAHEDVGKGHVYAYTDEWVTYTSQWNTQLAGYCSLDGSTANGDVPAAAAAYQVPQFWTNAISYAASATMCPFALPNTMPPR